MQLYLAVSITPNFVDATNKLKVLSLVLAADNEKRSHGKFEARKVGFDVDSGKSRLTGQRIEDDGQTGCNDRDTAPHLIPTSKHPPFGF